MSDLRIVSLIASATEIVCALGLEDKLVGRSHECDFPESLLSLPACSTSKVDVNSTSREIDTQVKSILREALSVYLVDDKQLDELKPTHIITQTQCEVCAVSLKDVEQAVCEIIGSKPKIIALEPMDLNDIWIDIAKVGRELGVVERAENLIAKLRKRLADIQNKNNREDRATTQNLPTVACVEWIDPLMAAGNWVPEMVEIAGGKNVFGKAGEHSPWLSWEELQQADPDFIVVMPCGFDLKRTRQEMQVLLDDSRWAKLSAVRELNVYLTDGNQYFNRPGPRVVESVEILAEILFPNRFDFRHEGSGWEVF